MHSSTAMTAGTELALLSAPEHTGKETLSRRRKGRLMSLGVKMAFIAGSTLLATSVIGGPSAQAATAADCPVGQVCFYDGPWFSGNMKAVSLPATTITCQNATVQGAPARSVGNKTNATLAIFQGGACFSGWQIGELPARTGVNFDSSVVGAWQMKIPA